MGIGGPSREQGDRIGMRVRALRPPRCTGCPPRQAQPRLLPSDRRGCAHRQYLARDGHMRACPCDDAVKACREKHGTQQRHGAARAQEHSGRSPGRRGPRAHARVERRRGARRCRPRQGRRPCGRRVTRRPPRCRPPHRPYRQWPPRPPRRALHRGHCDAGPRLRRDRLARRLPAHHGRLGVVGLRHRPQP